MVDRVSVIQKLRARRKTLGEIGIILGISRQRVHQIINGYVSTSNKIITKVKNRDCCHCVICEEEKNLEVHHINGIKRDNNLKNLVTLCRKCHQNITQKETETKWIKEIQEKGTLLGVKVSSTPKIKKAQKEIKN